MSQLPLEGIRVTEITNAWAGPYATQLMGDWGAEVIRVESRYRSTRGLARPDPAFISPRQAVRLFSYPDKDPGARPWNRSAFPNAHMRNKLSVTMDLTRPEGREIFRKLIAVSDVFLENNVPVTMEQFDITWEKLSEINPRLIMVRMPGYGLSGPYKDFRGLGSHMEAIAGHTLIRSYPDTAPGQQSDVFPADAAGGAAAVFATILALLHRKKTGEGQLIEFATAENFMPLIGDIILDYTMNGRLFESMGNMDRSMAPHNVYQCAGDDRWVAIACRDDKDWEALCGVMGNPAWTGDPRFADSLSRFRNRDALDEHIRQWTVDKEDQWVMRTLQAAHVPAGALFDERDSYEDPQLNARGFFEEVRHEEAGRHLYPSFQWKMRHTPNSIRRAPAMLGEHNEYVYKTLLGYGDEDYSRLESEGHISLDYDPSVP